MSITKTWLHSYKKGLKYNFSLFEKIAKFKILIKQLHLEVLSCIWGQICKKIFKKVSKIHWKCREKYKKWCMSLSLGWEKQNKNNAPVCQGVQHILSLKEIL